MFAVFFDKLFARLKKRFPESAVPIAFLQMFVSAVVLAFLYILGPTSIVLHFQRTIPGFIFPGMFFNVQSNIFETFRQI